VAAATAVFFEFPRGEPKDHRTVAANRPQPAESTKELHGLGRQGSKVELKADWEDQADLLADLFGVLPVASDIGVDTSMCGSARSSRTEPWPDVRR
jgi:hypothetical protein